MGQCQCQPDGMNELEIVDEPRYLKSQPEYAPSMQDFNTIRHDAYSNLTENGKSSIQNLTSLYNQNKSNIIKSGAIGNLSSLHNQRNTELTNSGAIPNLSVLYNQREKEIQEKNPFNPKTPSIGQMSFGGAQNYGAQNYSRPNYTPQQPQNPPYSPNYDEYGTQSYNNIPYAMDTSGQPNVQKAEFIQSLPIAPRNRVPPELASLIKKKFMKYGEVFKLELISDNQFYNVLNQNPIALKVLSKMSKQLMDDLSTCIVGNPYYKQIQPIKVTNSTGFSQYYTGDYNQFGECHGKGLWVDNDNIYCGGFSHDQFEGKGLFINPYGDFYFGDFQKGRMNGRGKIVLKGKVTYHGDFKDCLKNGKGVERYDDGSIYKGTFVLGQKEGQGQYTFQDGTEYNGNFKNSTFDGTGEFKWANGNRYTGGFLGGKTNGPGCLEYPDGSVFNGYFNNGVKQGDGSLKLPNGNTYNGNWVNNLLHGPGILEAGPNRVGLKFRFGRLISRDDR